MLQARRQSAYTFPILPWIWLRRHALVDSLYELRILDAAR
jgi:hypothetical protein